MSPFRLALAAAFTLAMVAPAAAQDKDAFAKDELVVTGKRDREKRINDYVDVLTDVPGSGPLARFDDSSFCPGVVGLSPARAGEIVKRMRAVAEAAGVPAAKPGCIPNALVIIAGDKEEMIEALRRKYPAYFRDPDSGAINIPRQAGPATAWHLEAQVDRDGVPVGYDPEMKAHVVVSNRVASRLQSSMRPLVVVSVTVIEAKSLVGLTATQIADYAAMRAFTRTDPAELENIDAPTILTILDAPMNSEVPLTLTAWDFGYLRAFNSRGEFNYGARQRAEIRAEIKRSLERGGDERDAGQ